MAARKKTDPIPDTTHYRSRPTVPNPFGQLDQPFVGDLATVLARGRADRAIGLEPVIEYRKPGMAWTAYHPPVTCEELRRYQLAHELTESHYDPTSAKRRTTKRWKIEPHGYQAI